MEAVMKTEVPKQVVSRLKAQMFHLGLTLAATGVATALLHARPQLLFIMMAAGWMSSLFLFAGPERPAYWRIVASVLTSVIVMSGVYRYALSSFFG
jgi:hypothetical protein